MRKIGKVIKNTLRQYVNGTKGVISLFLVLVMLPFTSIALLLVQSARYQSAVQLVEEIVDCVGLSTIADFDSYLEQRFGLLALSQATTPIDSLNRYLTANLPALEHDFSAQSTAVEGEYSLADSGVMKAQLLEYSETTVMVESLYNGLDVDDLFKKLYEKLNMKDLNKIAEATTTVANVASSTADLISEVKTFIQLYDQYSSQRTEYEAAAMAFYTETKDLIDALVDAESELGEDETSESVYEQQVIKDAIEACKTARDTFQSEAEEMATSVDDMRKAIQSLLAKADAILENMHKADTAIDAASGGPTLQDQCTTTTSEWIQNVATEIINVLHTTVDTSIYYAEMQEQARLLREEKDRLGSVILDQVAGEDTTKYYIDANSLMDNIKNDFPIVVLDSVRDGIGNLLKNVVDLQDRHMEGTLQEDQATSLGKLLDAAAEMFKVTAYSNGELDANVAPDAFHQYNSHDLSFSSVSIMTSVQLVVASGQDFVDSLTSLNILKALKAVAEFLLGIGTFLVGIVTWAFETLVNIGKLVMSGSEIYNTFLLAGYCVYNLPCRTTYDTGKTLTGFSYSQIFDTMGGTSGNRFTGAYDDIERMVASSGSGNDPGFRGAEVEYMIVGAENELLNQSVTFFNLYMLRMLLNLIPIFKNEQVRTMAGAASVAGWVVYLAIIVAEPMIDALMLVNGQNSFLLKDYIYLTPGGMILLAQTLPSLTGLSGTSQSIIKDAMVAKDGEAKAHGDLKMNYQEHLMVLLLLSVEQSDMISRISNLVQMETAQYYKEQYAFDLDQSYTYLKVRVEGYLNSMFDVDALTKNGPFHITCTRHIGY